MLYCFHLVFPINRLACRLLFQPLPSLNVLEHFCFFCLPFHCWHNHADVASFSARAFCFSGGWKESLPFCGFAHKWEAEVGLGASLRLSKPRASRKRMFLSDKLTTDIRMFCNSSIGPGKKLGDEKKKKKLMNISFTHKDAASMISKNTNWENDSCNTSHPTMVCIAC